MPGAKKLKMQIRKKLYVTKMGILQVLSNGDGWVLPHIVPFEYRTPLSLILKKLSGNKEGLVVLFLCLTTELRGCEYLM